MFLRDLAGICAQNVEGEHGIETTTLATWFTFMADSEISRSTRVCAGAHLVARPELLKIALSFVFVALACGVDAQIYNVGSETTGSPKEQTKQTTSSDQSLGWGSNIQNARLARAAQLALQRGEFALALGYARHASQAAPNDPQLLFLLGYAARLNKGYQEAVEAYTRGLRLSTSSLDGLSGLAQTYSAMGRTDDAERLLKQVTTADPKRRDDLLMLGELYMRSASYTDAIDWLSRAERIQPAARAEVLIALSYQHLKQMDQASHYLELAKQHSPDNPEVQRTMAGFYREAGNYSEAISALKSIRKPKSDVMAELAYTYQLDGKLGESAALYAQAANASSKDLGMQLAAAQAAVSIGFIEKAIPFLDRATGLNANHYRLHAVRGEIARLQERNQDAAREYSLALDNLPPDPVEGPLYGIQLHLDLMGIYKEMDDDKASHHQLEMAQSAIGDVEGHVSTKAQYLRLRSLIRMNAGEFDSALIDIKEALTLKAHDRDNLQLNGDILMKLGRSEDAILVYKQVLALDAENRFALTALGYASRVAGHDQDAERYFRHLAQVAPSLYIPHLALGDLYTSQREFTKAQSSYDKAYALAPGKALIMAGGMNAAIEAHNLELAAKWLSRVTNKMEMEPQILREKERYLSFNGDYLESEKVGQKAIRVLPRDRDVVVYLGYDLLHLGKFDELLSLTSQYLNVFPKDPDIPLLTGYVHKHQGQREQARQDFTEALNRNPEIVTAYENRGYILNDLHLPEDAATDFNSAIEREPNNGEAHLGLAYANLDLAKPQAALQQAYVTEQIMGDSRDIHVICATAYGRQHLLAKAVIEYKAALKFTPSDGELQLGLGNTYFAERKYHDSIAELHIAESLSPENADVYALLARSYANLQDRNATLRYVQLAEQHVPLETDPVTISDSGQSSVFVSTGQALSTIGDQNAAMDRFRKALDAPYGDRMNVRLAIALLMAQEGHTEDAERQIALAMMEAEMKEIAPPTGTQLIAAADVFRSMHDYQLSHSYLQRAKVAGAPDAEIQIGMANNYIALGDTVKAQAELSAISVIADSEPDYQYLLAKANVLRQQHHGVEALTAFAQASNAGEEDQTVQEALLQAGADEGLRITPSVSVLSDFSIEPIFEDSTVYVLDSKLDAPVPVSSTDTDHLPPPRSSFETQWTNAYHLHLNRLPTTSGFFQVRNSRGEISVPSMATITNRNTMDYTLNIGLNPMANIGNGILALNSGIQATIRRDSESPVAMNQNLFRGFTYISTSSFFNVVSLRGYVIWEAGPFTESNLHSRSLSSALNFRVGAPWGKTGLLAGWGSSDQKITPTNNKDHNTSSYLGIEHKFSDKLNVKAVVEDLRAWRVVGSNSGIAQNLRPSGTVDFTPNHSWNLEYSAAYSSTRNFHVYDAIRNGISISYAIPYSRKFNDGSEMTVLQYPIRISAGFQQETFFNFTGGQNQQFKPYVHISLF